MKSRYFAFLRRLQAKGRSNMYGAVPYLMQAFELSREQAFSVVCEWLDRQSAPAVEVSAPVIVRHPKRTVSPRSRKRKRSKTRT